MKVKTLCKAVGAFNASLCGYIGYSHLSRFIHLNMYDFFLREYPFEKRLLAAGVSAYFIIPTALFGFGFVDGLVDLVKGTHHYFGLNVWKKLTRSEERKRSIDEEIENMLVRIEEPLRKKKNL